MAFEVNGYDVSKWQGDINWSVFGTKGDFYIIRAGSIDNITGKCYDDYQFHRNAQLGMTFGKPMGAYWYFRPQYSGIIQADYFSKLVESYKFQIKASLDGEETGTDSNGNSLSPNQVTSAAWVFMNRLKRNLGDGMIYTSPGFWSFITSWAYKFDLWNAQWPNDDSVTKPYIPTDWSSHGKQAKFWQHKVGNNGKELGFGIGSVGVDMNRFMGTREEFESLYYGGAIPPDVIIPTPEPTPIPQKIATYADGSWMMKWRDRKYFKKNNKR